MDICKHASFCGGCSFQGVEYSEQLERKQELVDKLIASKKLKIENKKPIVPAPKIYGYRNKMEYTFGDEQKGGEMTLGFHQKGRFHSITTVDECQLVSDDFNRILRGTLNFALEKGYPKYNKKTHEGLMRNLVVRCGERTDELLLNIITQSEERARCTFDAQAYVDAMLALPLDRKIVGIVHTENDRFSDAVHGSDANLIYGRDFYVEKIMGLDFQVGCFTFFQTNISAVERLYSDAISLIDDFQDKKVFDLFCGTGTIAQSVAKGCKSVIGVDIVEDSILAARENAKRNGLENCEFICGDVFKVLNEIDEKPDIVIVDPPRAGIEAKALDKILSYEVPEIVYISCNPKTLVSNLYYLQYFGYEIKHFQAYDNFPWTDHVETVVLMSRRRD